MRPDGRESGQLRNVSLARHYAEFAEGSCLIQCGSTKVLCTASVEYRTQPFLAGTGRGWVTAEYSMLPRSTPERTPREVKQGRPSGRTQEIQRLIGRALRSVIDLNALGECTITVDCDCLGADGGTRTASITGGFVALVDALRHLEQDGWFQRQRPAAGEWRYARAVRDHVAAVSVAIVDGVPCLDVDYAEDSRADVDMNVVMTGSGGFVEVQGTAEGEPFDRDTLDGMLNLAASGIDQLIEMQRSVLEADFGAPPTAERGARSKRG